MRFVVVVGLMCSCLVAGASAQTIQEIMKERMQGQALSDEVQSKWPAEAFVGWEKVQGCFSDASCPKKACEGEVKKLDWLAGYCRANLAAVAGNVRSEEKEIERAYLALLKHYPTRQHRDTRRAFSDVDVAEKEGRVSRMRWALRETISDYAIWQTYRSMLAGIEAQRDELREKAEGGDAEAQFDYAFKLYGDRRDPKSAALAAQWFAKAAEQGVAVAAYNLGVMHEHGQGIPHDDVKAVEWYRQAALKGYAPGQRAFGLMLVNGKGIAKDEKAGIDWYHKAAEQGDADSQYHLGIAFANGNLVSKDDVLAVEWLRKSAEQGHAGAQRNLGVMIGSGAGVAKDDALALEWARKAAQQGNAAAQNDLGMALEDGRGAAKDEAAAAQWFRKAAEQGHVYGQYNLGRVLALGQGVVKDEAAAVDWYRKAAEQGHARAQFNLGVMLSDGIGVAKDEVAAVDWYRKAAEQGQVGAQFNLGARLVDGRGVPKDEVAAVAWFRKAAEQGSLAAQNYLGTMYQAGRGGLLQDASEASQWFKKAARAGDGYAQRNLASLYVSGMGVPKSLVTAHAWMNLAASAGHDLAPAEREKIAALLTPADVEKAQKLAREWKRGELLAEVKASPVALAAKAPVQGNVGGGGSPFPAKPAKVPGRTSCNTRCVNGDCYRTYDDGRQIRIQATRKMNPFGEWVWDAGNC